MFYKDTSGTNGSQPPKSKSEKSSDLEEELKFFENNRKKWLALHKNEFAVVSGSILLGFFPDFVSAWQAGAHEFGPLASFLVKEVLTEDPIYFIF